MIVILLGILALSSITQINAQQTFADLECNADTVYNSPPPYNAIAYIYDYASGYGPISGWVQFSQSGCYQLTTITGSIYGLTDGPHGCHVHAFGDTSNGCNSMGSHYNPYQQTHGGETYSPRHVGDLGNINSENGVATIYMTSAAIDVLGPNSIIGRAVVFHANIDDLGLGTSPDSQTTGNSGPRAACGIIQIQ